MTYRGVEVAPLDLTDLPGIVADFQAESVEAVAISLLHAYANPAHEEAAFWPNYAACGPAWPALPLTRSRGNGASTSGLTPPSCPPMCSPRLNVICVVWMPD